MSQPAIKVRAERPNDYESIDQIVAAAFLAEFGTTTEAALIRRMRERSELVAELTLVAETDGRVVGHIAFSEVTLDGRVAHGLGLAPVAVTPHMQKSGIGSQLIATALAEAERDGWEFVVLLGHAAYYSKFGFVPASAHGLTGEYGDHDGWMVRSLGGSPIPSGHVRYCSSFAE